MRKAIVKNFDFSIEMFIPNQEDIEEDSELVDLIVEVIRLSESVGING